MRPLDPITCNARSPAAGCPSTRVCLESNDSEMLPDKPRVDRVCIYSSGAGLLDDHEGTWLRTMGIVAKAIAPNIPEANTTVTRFTSCLPAVRSGNNARAAMGIPTMALYDHPRFKLSMTSGSDHAIGSARQTSPRIPLLCERAATRPRNRHTGPAITSQGTAPRHPAKSPTDSRSANKPWYERSHARRYAAIISAPSTLAFRIE